MLLIELANQLVHCCARLGDKTDPVEPARHHLDQELGILRKGAVFVPVLCAEVTTLSPSYITIVLCRS